MQEELLDQVMMRIVTTFWFLDVACEKGVYNTILLNSPCCEDAKY